MINYINLETNFYNTFRNTFKKIISSNENIKVKNAIINIVNDNTILYFDKINKLYNLLKIIGEKTIIFAKYSQEVLNNITEISMCINNNCDSEFCFKSDDNSCSLIIPEFNLISNDLDKIKEIDQTFNADEFLSGSRTFFKMVLESFTNDNLEKVQNFIKPSVLESFKNAIDDRNKEEETLIIDLKSIDKNEILSHKITKTLIKINVIFESETQI